MDYQLSQTVKIYAGIYGTRWPTYLPSVLQNVANDAGMSFNYDGTIYNPVVKK